MTRVDSSVLLMHHDPGRSWITDPDPDHPKECTQNSVLTDFELIYFVSYRQLKGLFTMQSIGFLVWISCLTTFICGNNNIYNIYCIRYFYSERVRMMHRMSRQDLL